MINQEAAVKLIAEGLANLLCDYDEYYDLVAQLVDAEPYSKKFSRQYERAQGCDTAIDDLEDFYFSQVWWPAQQRVRSMILARLAYELA